MKQCLKITAGVFLLVQTFHSASLQYSTDSPRPTINSSWLREQGKTNSGMRDAAVAGDDAESDQRADGAAVSTYDYSAGITSGSIDIYIEEGENVTSQDRNSNEGSDVPGDVTNTESPSDLRDKTEQPILPETNVSASTAAMDSRNSSQVNTTEVEEESNNSTATPPHSSTTSTTHLIAEKSTSALEDSNNTDSQATLAPEGTARPESTTKPADNTSLTDTTESIDANETVPEIAEGSTSSPATVSRTAEMSPETTRSTAAQNTPEKANNTGKESIGGSSTDRGFESDSYSRNRKRAWAAVLGTAVAVCFVALVVYVLLKHKQQTSFSHKKLVEEYPTDPVHRLDNIEPLDLDFGPVAYYNPALQGDNIQMLDIPGRL